MNHHSLPTVTVITVCYNAKEALKTTMRSVFAQRYDALEYVIVDGASTDGSAELIKQSANKVDHWVSEPDNGIYDAMNKGARQASGEWVMFLNAGDEFASEDVLRRIFEHDIQADIVYGDVVKDGVVKEAEPPLAAHRMFFCHQSCLTRRSCLLRTPFDTTHKLSADFKFFKQMYRERKRFKQLHFPIAVFDTGGISNRKRSMGLKDNMRVIAEVDDIQTQIRLLPRLCFVYLLCKLRGK